MNMEFVKKIDVDYKGGEYTVDIYKVGEYFDIFIDGTYIESIPELDTRTIVNSAIDYIEEKKL